MDSFFAAMSNSSYCLDQHGLKKLKVSKDLLYAMAKRTDNLQSPFGQITLK